MRAAKELGVRGLKRVIVVLLLVFTLLIGAAGVSAGGGVGAVAPEVVPDGQALVLEKDEVVYARLSGNGVARDAYVVNHFSLAEGGLIVDRGGYTSVVNLSDLQPIALEDGIVTVRTRSENFFYQGYLAGAELPWIYDIEYVLDGAAIAPESLAGKSGELEIYLASRKNSSVDDVFYDNYMQQISITLDTEKCSEIKTDGATTANAGKNRILVYTVLPKRDADITVSASVADFEMPGIDISAMPFSMSIESMNMYGLDNMLDDFTQLTDAIAELGDGVEKLSDGAFEMASGSVSLRSGSTGFLSGLNQINGNAGQLTDGSEQIMGALSQLARSLSSPGEPAGGIAGLEMLPGALSELAGGLSQVSGGMRQLTAGYGQAYAALDGAIAGIPDYRINDAQLGGLYAAAGDDERALLDRLVESYASAMTVKGTYEQVQTALMSVGASLEGLAGSADTLSASMNEMSAQMSGMISGNDSLAQIQQLSFGMAELSQRYAGFHNGLVAYTGGISDIVRGYRELDTGIAELRDGITEFSNGIAELRDGTDRLVDETSDMPERVRKEIDNVANDYLGDGGEFEPASFTSGSNENISFVQFVFKADGIELPAPEKAAPPNGGGQSFLDRLKALFG